MTKKVKIRTLGRVISDLSEFGLYGVAGMLIEGSLTVFWATGRSASTTLEYGIDDSNPSNFTSITISGNRKYHEVSFPVTFIDTNHFFRVRSIDAITGKEKVSIVYRIYVPKTLALSTELWSTLVTYLSIEPLKTIVKTKSDIKTNILMTQLSPNISSSSGNTYHETYGISVQNHEITNYPTIINNILTTSIS